VRPTFQPIEVLSPDWLSSSVRLVPPTLAGQKRSRSDSPPSNSTSPSTCAESRLEEKKEKKRKRKRGSGSNGGTHGNRARAGKALSKFGGAKEPARLARLQERSYVKGQVIQATYSIETDGSVTTTGWQGAPPPKLAQKQILQLYQSGEIKSLLALFHPIGYSR
jgi:hypothetical protein